MNPLQNQMSKQCQLVSAFFPTVGYHIPIPIGPPSGRATWGSGRREWLHYDTVALVFQSVAPQDIVVLLGFGD
jgi:hypothetical protein